jgi:hypothetical protein
MEVYVPEWTYHWTDKYDDAYLANYDSLMGTSELPARREREAEAAKAQEEALAAGLSIVEALPGKLDISQREFFLSVYKDRLFLPGGLEVEYGLQGPILYEHTADPKFHIAPADVPVWTIKCTICGGNTFNVGGGEYAMIIRCVTCGWERCIHEG